MAVSRETLFEEVWAEPMLRVAARYGVSSSFLGRVCERLNVPRPGRGYWAQLEVGKADPKPALPELRPGDELEWARDGEPRRFFRPTAHPGDPPAAPTKRTFPPGTTHPVLAGARDIFSAAAPNDTGYLRPTKRKLVDVFVSKEQLERALDFLDALFKALEARGHRVDLGSTRGDLRRLALDVREGAKKEYHWFRDWAPDRPTVANVKTVAFGLTLFELTEEVEARHLNGKYVRLSELPPRRGGYPSSSWTTTHTFATGRLGLRVSSAHARVPWEKQWRESKPGELATKVNDVVRTLAREAPGLAERVAEAERQAELERRRWEEQHRRWEAEERERRRLQDAAERERRRLQAIKDSRDQLLAAIESFRFAQAYESFFADVERRAAELDDAARGEIVEKVHKARALLGGVDALERFAHWMPPEEAAAHSVEAE